MKESMESSASSVEEAIKQALNQLGVTREEVRVTVLDEGKRGVLGLGSEPARVSVELLEPAAGNDDSLSEVARAVLEALLAGMDIEAAVETQVQPAVGEGEIAAPIAFDIRGDDLGILIGRRGQTLSCLQFMVRLIVGHQTKTWVPITVDVEGYRLRRSEKLMALAGRLAEQVRTRRSPFTLEPMLAYERRIIHLALADHPDVTTESIGEGEARRVVIRLKR
ncbi:MAG TPA: protein jag [Dehalococcoidia bacterium]|nr:protein jag [Dehalococcoidia bacterium]